MDEYGGTRYACVDVTNKRGSETAFLQATTTDPKTHLKNDTCVPGRPSTAEHTELEVCRNTERQ